MNKHFKFTRCLGDDWPYDCAVTTYIPSDPNMFDADYEDECYVLSIMSVLGEKNVTRELEMAMYTLSSDQLLNMSERLDIIVEIIENEG